MAVGVLALRDGVGKFFLTNKSGNAVISPLGFFPRGFFDYKSVYLIVRKKFTNKSGTEIIRLLVDLLRGFFCFLVKQNNYKKVKNQKKEKNDGSITITRKRS